MLRIPADEAIDIALAPLESFINMMGENHADAALVSDAVLRTSRLSLCSMLNSIEKRCGKPLEFHNYGNSLQAIECNKAPECIKCKNFQC